MVFFKKKKPLLDFVVVQEMQFWVLGKLFPIPIQLHN